jgi:hypothetical protein
MGSKYHQSSTIPHSNHRHFLYHTETKRPQKLTLPQKRSRITTLRKADRLLNKNILRLTHPKSITTAQLALVNNAGKTLTVVPPSVAVCHARLRENWQMKFDAMWAVPGQVVKPRGPDYEWDPKLLLTLVVLSEMTLGQGVSVRRMVVAAVRERGGEVMKTQDVVGVIEWLYGIAR